jgi:hypothetical protein
MFLQQDNYFFAKNEKYSKNYKQHNVEQIFLFLFTLIPNFHIQSIGWKIKMVNGT